MIKQRLGEILVGAKALSPEMRDKAVAYRAKHKVRFGTVLLELGMVSEELLLRALSVQTQTPPARGSDIANIRPDVLRLVPPKLAAKFCAVPFRRSGRNLAVAMRDPKDLPAIDEIAFLTGLSIVPHVALEARLLGALEKYYGIQLEARFRALLDRLDQPQVQSAPAAPPAAQTSSYAVSSRTSVPPMPPPPAPRPYSSTPAAPTWPSAGNPQPQPVTQMPPVPAGATPPNAYYDPRAASYAAPYRTAQAPPVYPAAQAPAPVPARAPQTYRPQSPQPVVQQPPYRQPVPQRQGGAEDPWGAARALEPELLTESDLELETTEVSARSGALSQPIQLPQPEPAPAPVPPPAVTVERVRVPVPATPPVPVPATSIEPTAEDLVDLFAPGAAPVPVPVVETKTRPVAVAPVEPPPPSPPPLAPTPPLAAPVEPEPVAQTEPAPVPAPVVEPVAASEPVQVAPVVAEETPGPAAVVEVVENAGPGPVHEALPEAEAAPPLEAVEAPQLVAVAAVLPPEEEQSEESLEPEPPPSFGDLVQRLSNAESRDDIADAILAGASEKVQRCALFIVQADQAIGWSARPSPPEGFRSFALPFKLPSVFASLRNSEGFYTGPCPDLPANRKILQAIGATFPADIMVLPVTLKGKSVLFLAGVTGTGDPATLIADLRRLGTMTATALEILLLKNRLRNT